MSAEQSAGRLDSAPGALALRFQLQYDDVETFVRSYAVNLSPGGMFIATREPPAVGTVVRFEVVLADSRPVLRGEGLVVWTAGGDPGLDPSGQAASIAPSAASIDSLSGLGVRFGRLDAPSRAVIARVLAHKAAHPDLFFTKVPDPYAVPAARPDYRPSAASLPELAHSAASTRSAASAHSATAFPSAASAHSAAPSPSATSAHAATAHPSAEFIPSAASAHAATAPPSADSAHSSGSAGPAPSSISALDELLQPLHGLPPTSQWTPTGPAPLPHVDADEEAALKALLQPVSPTALPTATDAARLLEELLDRRPG